MLEVFIRVICQRLRISRLILNIIRNSTGIMHSASSVSCQLTHSMIIKSSTSVKQSISTFTIPFVNRSFSELTSLITRTSILPGERESKNENDRPCMCLNRSSRSVASALRPAISIRRILWRVHSAPTTASTTMPIML